MMLNSLARVEKSLGRIQSEFQVQILAGSWKFFPRSLSTLARFLLNFFFVCSSEIGETPLHKAAETSSVAVVKLLLDEGAEINPKTDAKVQMKHHALYL